LINISTQKSKLSKLAAAYADQLKEGGFVMRTFLNVVGKQLNILDTNNMKADKLVDRLCTVCTFVRGPSLTDHLDPRQQKEEEKKSNHFKRSSLLFNNAA
jgi:hypothetical protein